MLNKILKNPLLRGVSRSDGVCREVVDFFCPEIALVIEIDGNSHDKENAYQRERSPNAMEARYGWSQAQSKV
jgi:very-short-patch-repair endonuclease